MGVYPYSFRPIHVEKVWGGRALERLFGRELPPGARIGESWELADLPEGSSVVSAGADAGKTLGELLAEKGPAVLGPGVSTGQGRFPLLLKLLDANDILSLQVHPDPAAAEALGPPAAPKTECWYVLESRGGYILKGVRPGVSAAGLREVLAGGGDAEALAGLLERFDVQAGDFHWLPAGTLHALGPQVVVAEVQTPSDTTYRVSDWGRGRQVHLEQAFRCIHFEPAPPPPGAGGEVLVSCPYFAVRRRVLPPGTHRRPPGGCAAWMTIAGRAVVRAEGGQANIAAGDTLLLPAGLGAGTVTVDEALTVLEVTLPE